MLHRRAGRGLTLFALRGSVVFASSAAQPPLHVVFGGKSTPHPEKLDKGGEDAWFYDDRISAFGIADGVGGSASRSVDPGMFSRELLRRCHGGLHRGTEHISALPNALQMAHKEDASGAASTLQLGGSSTVLLGQLEPETHALRLINLGDSGAMLLRPSPRRFPNGPVLWPRVVLRSQEQTHVSACPPPTHAG